MDSSSSSSSSQDWLGFSLSHHHGQPTSDHSQLCLFEAFNTTQEQDNVHLSLFDGGRKLEDFLGGGARALPVGQFSGEATTHESHEPTGMYDSDLKTIAASFLRGYSSTIDQTTTTTTTTAKTTNSYKAVAVVPVETSSKKSVDNFGQRTSIYRGVTRHRWTGRYEAHLWDNSCRREGQSRKGRQVYLGGYDKEEKAARAYDLAALKYWGPTTTTNFPVSDYEKEIEEMKNMSRQEFVASLRRKSSGFSRGASIYRGVTRHHQHGRWQARIGRVAGNKDLYLGTFSTEEEAAEAYDIAAIKFRGLNAVTNFDMSRYDVKSIANSNLPIGGINNDKTKASSAHESTENKIPAERSSSLLADELDNLSSVTSPSATTLNFAIPIKQDPSDCNWINGINVGPGLQSLSSSSNMDYYQTNNINRFWNTGVVVQQQSSSTLIPFAAPITVSGNSYESSSYGNWVSASPHSYQAAKPNISVFQTPIFGME